MKRKSLFIIGLVLMGLSLFAQQKPIRTAWLTNTASTLMYSREGIKKAVSLAKQAGLTHICTVVWNKGYTQFRSQTMQEYFGITLDPAFAGFDPLQALIEEAHREKIGVIAWFEFGFAAAYLDSGMHLLKRYPHWTARDINGKPATVNQFTWMNSFHPEVQAFLKKLVLEVVARYDVDGIQGDDRMPAGPTIGGYDAYTISAYRSEHQGAYPPADELDSAWVQWRSDRLTAWGKELYSAVKALKPDVLVAHAPSVYPWSKEHYLQDWPTWMQLGITDVVMPQVYRYSAEAYRKTLEETMKYAKPFPQQVVPGILAALGNGFTMEPSLLKQMVEANRAAGLSGEAFFYFEALQRLPDFFNKTYQTIR